MAPGQIQRPRERLASAKRLSSLPTSRISSTTTTKGPARPRPRKTARTCCDKPEHVVEESRTVCLNCGQEVSDANIVSEVTFGETSAGAAVVQGTQVGENQRFAKSNLGPGFRGGMATESREQTERSAKNELRQLAGSLHLAEFYHEQAMNVYRLSLNNNFTQGRSPKLVAAICLYAICRQQKGNKILLMDLAEQIKVNVFKVGEAYKTLCKELFIDDQKNQAERLNPVEVEPLIDKFARRLEFGDFHTQVATDAVRILARMDRDWMVSGRTPAGLCGACIILAARMNNFRRSVREVVYVVRVADVTISKRLEEFKRTKAGSLSVDQFRKFAHRLKDTEMPPAIYNAEIKKNRKRTRLVRDVEDVETAIQQGLELAPEDPATDAPSPQKRPRVDRDGFAVPDLPAGRGTEPPIDPTLLQAVEVAQTELNEQVVDAAQNDAANSDTESVASSTTSTTSKRGRGRPRKNKKKEKAPPPVITEFDLIVEEELERQMEKAMASDAAQRFIREEHAGGAEIRAKALADRMRNSGNGARNPALNEEIIGEKEFEDDPEVRNCVLTPAEVAIKEKIWVTHNEDWMRQQQARLLEKEMAEAKGKKKQKPRGKRGRIGDGSLLEGREVNSPSDAVEAMINKRAAPSWSKHIDYERLRNIYSGTGEEASSGRSSRAGSTSEARSPTSGPSQPRGTTSRTMDPPAPRQRAEIATAASVLPTPPNTQVAASQSQVPSQAPIEIPSDHSSDESDEPEDEIMQDDYDENEGDDRSEAEEEPEEDDYGPQYQ